MVYDYGFRIYDPRIAKFLSVDPLTSSYPWYTPYQFAGNKPIWAIDLDGLEEYYATTGELLGKYGVSIEIRVVNDNEVERAREQLAFYKAASVFTDNEYLSKTLYSQGSVSLLDYSSNVSDVLEGQELIDYFDYGNCFDCAKKQLENAGVNPSSPVDAFQTKVNNEKQDRSGGDQLTENKAGGLIYAITQLKSGNPVMMGVESRDSE